MAYRVAALLALASCGAPTRDPDFEAAQKAVRAELLDPGSAQFRNLRHANELAEGPYREPFNGEPDILRHPAVGAGVCGEFNAKNRMGGYSGFRGFIWVKDQGQVLIASEAGAIRWYDGVPVNQDAEPLVGGHVGEWLRWSEYCRDR